MVKINRVYTKKGDDGSTGLVGGMRVSKSAQAIDCVGEIDELNSILGMIRTLLSSSTKGGTSTKKKKPSRKGGTAGPSSSEIVDLVASIQNDLFDIGSQLATPPELRAKYKIPPTTIKQVQALEDQIDRVLETIPDLTSFVLPGGNQLNAWFHIARAITRRAERKLTAGNQALKVSDPVKAYINRLSDLFFVLARFVLLSDGHKEYLWQPGASLKNKS